MMSTPQIIFGSKTGPMHELSILLRAEVCQSSCNSNLANRFDGISTENITETASGGGQSNNNTKNVEKVTQLITASNKILYAWKENQTANVEHLQCSVHFAQEIRVHGMRSDGHVKKPLHSFRRGKAV